MLRGDGSDAWSDAELKLIGEYRSLAAIRAYKERTGCSLMQAKISFDGIEPGVVKTAKLCPHCGGRGFVDS